MNNYIKKLQDELNNCQLIPMFEIEVQDEHGQIEYITCDIYFKGNSIVAERDAVSLAEETSRYIPATRLLVADRFCLDENLQDLYAAVVEDIEAGEFYEIPQ